MRIGPTAVRRATILAAMASVAGWGCGDLLQEPESGSTPLPVLLEEVSGNHQEAAPGAPLPETVRVRVRNAAGQPAPGLWVEWSVLGGSGDVRPRNAFSDAAGVAAATWTLGAEPGAQQVRAFVRGGAPMVFEATAVIP